jgi:hypothetical protein
MQRAKSNSLDGQGEEISFSHMRDYSTQESIRFRKKPSGRFGRHSLGTAIGDACLRLAAQVLRSQELRLGARQPSCDNKVFCTEVFIKYVAKDRQYQSCCTS